jgi:hypothetical protein
MVAEYKRFVTQYYVDNRSILPKYYQWLFMEFKWIAFWSNGGEDLRLADEPHILLRYKPRVDFVGWWVVGAFMLFFITEELEEM